jgi:hypothetical protein
MALHAFCTALNNIEEDDCVINWWLFIIYKFTSNKLVIRYTRWHCDRCMEGPTNCQKGIKWIAIDNEVRCGAY